MAEGGSPGKFAAWLRRWADDGVVEVGLVTALEELASAELRRRRMWSRPPQFLGEDAFDSWEEPGALRALALDIAGTTLLPRLARLRALIDVYENVDGYVVRNVRNHLHGQHAKADTIGAKSFKNVKRLLQERLLSFHPSDIDVALGPHGRAWLQTSGPIEDQPCSEAALQVALRTYPKWGHLALVVGRTVSREVSEALLAALSCAAAHGVAVFRPYDLLHVLTEAARHTPLPTDVAAFNAEPERILAGLALDQLERAIAQEIAQLPHQRRKKEGMMRTLELLAQLVRDDEEIPSRNELARRLGYSATALHNYMNALAKLTIKVQRMEQIFE